MLYYVFRPAGIVRGKEVREAYSCGHHHQTYKAAFECLRDKRVLAKRPWQLGVLEVR